MGQLIDLSGPIEEGQPVYPGNQTTAIQVTATHEESGYAWAETVQEDTNAIRRKLAAKRRGDDEEHPLVRSITMSEHGPTHVDALTHLDPTNDESIDELPLDRFWGDAIGLDVSHVPSDEFITSSILKEVVETSAVRIRDGDAVTLHTGHHEQTYAVADHEKRYAYLHDYPGLDEGGMRWLAERGVSNVGVDAPSIDHASAMETKDYPAHDICADYEVLNMENMANLDVVAGRRFKLAAFPLKIDGGTGSPIRPVAIIE